MFSLDKAWALGRVLIATSVVMLGERGVKKKRGSRSSENCLESRLRLIKKKTIGLRQIFSVAAPKFAHTQ